jgi:predicted metalloprotease
MRGTVLFGLRLLGGEIQTHALGGNSVIAIMAHEWGHILQFSNGVSGGGKGPELSADCMAGWWLGLKATKGVAHLDVNSVARTLFEKGDYNFNSRLHHGTPQERVNALAYGFALATQRGVSNALGALQESLR